MGKAKSAKRKAPDGVYYRGGMDVPFRVVPLAVWSAWRDSDWSAVDETKYEYDYDRETRIVTVEVKHSGGQRYKRKVGKLPAGWDCDSVEHHESGTDGYYVGPAATIKKLESLCEQRDSIDREIGAILHHNIIDGVD